MHLSMKDVLHCYEGLDTSKKEYVWGIMEGYYDKLPKFVKKEMGYELAVIVYGESLAEHEAEQIVSEMPEGQHWTMDEVRSLVHAKAINFDKEGYSLGDLYAIMHAEYHNHHEFIHSMTNDRARITEYAFMLAHGFLQGERGKGKARKYFHFVV